MDMNTTFVQQGDPVFCYQDLKRIRVGWGALGEVTIRVFREGAESDNPEAHQREYTRYYWGRMHEPHDATIVTTRERTISAYNQRRIWKEMFPGPVTEEIVIEISYYEPTCRVCIGTTINEEPVWASWRLWQANYRVQPVPLFWRSAHGTKKDDLILYIDDELDKATLSIVLRCYDDHGWKDKVLSLLNRAYNIEKPPFVPASLTDLLNDVCRTYVRNNALQSRVVSTAGDMHEIATTLQRGEVKNGIGETSSEDDVTSSES